MDTFSMLVLTDHRTHSGENSLYALLHALRQHPACARLDVASRSTPGNRRFFYHYQGQLVYATSADEHFHYSPQGRAFRGRLRRVDIQEYDSILLRLPPPVDVKFARHLSAIYPEQHIINQPSGIVRTSNKAFLLELPELCPPMALCTSMHDIERERNRYPLVLKPLNEYGGKGLIKIADNRVWENGKYCSFRTFTRAYNADPRPLLAMPFLERVAEGDKRIVVCAGQIVGASLRLPANGSWLCNAAQGGVSVATTIAPEERRMARQLARRLHKEGVFIFGFDTLVNNDGRRVLSEINTMSIGGLKQMEAQSRQPILQNVADLLWGQVKQQKQYGNSIVRS